MIVDALELDQPLVPCPLVYVRFQNSFKPSPGSPVSLNVSEQEVGLKLILFMVPASILPALGLGL